jgi:hypothetical protein
MSQTLINELKEENLCTYFVLPLLKLNKFSFTSSNFVNCYLTKSLGGKRIVVQVVDLNLVSRNAFTDALIYRVLGKGDFFLVYPVAALWSKDIDLFIEGKFSTMSKKAKEAIKRFSGLVKNTNGRTDGRLLALDKHPVLKDMWERELSSDDNRPTGRIDLAEDAELLSIPGEKSYISLEGMVRI